MGLYAVLRRSGWRCREELGRSLQRSAQVVEEQMPDDIRWIRSYVLSEDRGEAGTVCVVQAISPEAIRRHATLAGLPVDEILAIADTVLVAQARQDGPHLTL